MSKARSVCRDWEFVSKGTEISLGKFVSEYFTPLTLDSRSGVVSTEDTDEIWKTAKEEAMEEVKGRANRLVGADSPMVEEAEVEKSFWLSRTDGWVINRKTKKIIMIGLRALAAEREWEVAVVPLVTGQRVMQNNTMTSWELPIV
jgi:hypothetical protein